MEWKYSKITDYLYIGTEMEYEDIPLIKEKLDIKIVVDLRAEYPTDGSEFIDLGMKFFNIKIFDIMPATQEQIKLATDIFLKGREEKANIYLFCTSGERRSPAMAMACLVSLGYSTEMAYKEIKEKWELSRPNTLQIEAVKEFENSLKK